MKTRTIDEDKRAGRHDASQVGGKDLSVKRGRNSPEGNLAPVIGRWAEAYFPVGSQTTESELRELLKEAADQRRMTTVQRRRLNGQTGTRSPRSMCRATSGV
jgi:hypothetical protein